MSDEATLLKKTRKAFTIEYSCSVFLLLVMVYAFFKGVSVPPLLQKIVLGVSLIVFVSAEFSRYLIRYLITPEKVIITKGIFRQHKRTIHFHPLSFVPDINIRQSAWQRLFNYGTVYVQGASGEHQLEIKDIDNPQKIMKLIEDYIDLTRNASKKRQ
ncbi:MAG TPA: PH domain-containing protein [Candidatus Nanoarchaeia archaeon]|nr:PH domain-containing protein [Candidatus Nanoarchaeia archaeon]